jgi:phage terminase small subunit
MARHAQPREVARLKGADKKDPQRYRGEAPKRDMPLGNAPAQLSEDAAACWFELQSLALPGVMTGADRIMFEVASNLMAEYRRDPVEFAVGKYAHLIGLLARFGMSPADRQKLAVEKPKSDNPYADLTQ